MNNINDMLGKMTEFLKAETKTENIIGKEFKLGEYSCVPVMTVGMGFGGGGGEGETKERSKGTIEGEGAGIGMAPVGFLVSRGNEIHFIPTRTAKGLDAAIGKIPELVDKYFEKTNIKKKETEKV